MKENIDLQYEKLERDLNYFFVEMGSRLFFFTFRQSVKIYFTLHPGEYGIKRELITFL